MVTGSFPDPRSLCRSVTEACASSVIDLYRIIRQQRLMMASLPIVLCYSFSSPPVPAFSILLELARQYEGDFTLLDQVSVTDLTENQRELVQGIVCTGGFLQDEIKLGKETIDLLPNLKVISTPSTGVNHIDLEAATAHGIRVGHSPGHFLSDAVAEFAFGLLLASARSIVLGEKTARTITPSQVRGTQHMYGTLTRGGVEIGLLLLLKPITT